MSLELNRKLSVVYFSDIVGYTRLMGRNEDAAFELMKKNLAAHSEIFGKHRGKIIKELGDGILAVFETVPEALSAALEIQRYCKESGEFELRIGMHRGEVIFDHGDVFGDAVNLASRIQSVGTPSSILISEKVFQTIPIDHDFPVVKLGGFSLKNVEHEIDLYALTNPPLAVPKRNEILNNIKYQQNNSWKFWVGLSVVFVLLTLLIYSVFWSDNTWEKDKSVAVLPFINLNGNPELDYFTDGLTENLIGQISKINSIKTISYSTMDDFKNQNQSLDSIAEALEVTTILKGTVEKLNLGYRFKLQLVDVKENKNIWTDEYTREGTDITQLQNDVAREIANILNAKLTAEESIQIGKGETTNVEAYDLLFKSKKLYNEGFGDPQKFIEAVELLKRAIILDPNYALAYTLLAKTYFQIAYDDPNGPWYNLSLDMSSKALELEPKLSEGYSARGIVYYDLGQYTKAKNTLETALSFYPNLSDAIGNLATIEFAQGNLYEALSLQMKSSNLGPNNYLPYQNMGWINKILGKYQEAHFWFEKSLEQNQNSDTYELNAFTYIQEGKIDSALIEAQKVLKMKTPDYKVLGFIYFYAQDFELAFNYLQKEMESLGLEYPKYTSVPIAYSYLLKQKGNVQLSNTILNEIIQVKIEAISLGFEDYYLPLDLATAYAILDQPEESLKYLQIAYERGWRDYFFTEYNEAFDTLKEDPRYQKILSQIQQDILEVNQKLASSSLERDK